MHVRFHLFILSLLFMLPGFSQTALPDSAVPVRDSSAVSYFLNDVDREGSLKLHPLDTALTGFQNYDLLTRDSRFFATPGNIGSAYRDVVPTLASATDGFDFGTHTFDGYLYQSDSARYYRVVKTYTELEYVQGAKKELNFIARFSRNIYRGLNLGFDFHTSSSPGAYQRQKTNLVNFILTAQYLSKTKRYGVLANFTANRIKNEENGGIKYDSVFTEGLETNREVFQVNLSSAQNRIREIGFYMKHYFDLTRHVLPQADSAGPPQRRVELGRLTYSFSYDRQIFNYTDGNLSSGFYTHFYIDTTQTADSVTIQRMENTISWTNPNFNPTRKFRRIQLEFRLTHQYIEVTYPAIRAYQLRFDPAWASVELLHPHQRHYFSQWIPSAWIAFRPFNTFTLQAKAGYTLGDYNEGDVSLDVEASQILGSMKRNIGRVTLTGQYRYRMPAWFYEQYRSNNFQWTNTWEKEGVIAAAATYATRYFTVGASMTRLTNYVYLDIAAIPQQEPDEVGVIRAWANTGVELWRFRFDGQFAYQIVQGTNVIRVPAFTGDLTIYFTQPLLKGAALLQPGLHFFYNTAYYADAYMPATRMFHLQDQTEIGNYLYMDVFINVKIQRARFFITYTHFNSSFMGRNYFMVPHYPMPDAAFKFGVSWRFHD